MNRMNKAGLINLIKASGLPEPLRAYLCGVLAGNLPFSLREALKKEPDKFIKDAAGLLREAGLALGRSPEEALSMSGFDSNNLAPDRLEAALAELLAVVFLCSEGFSGLGFIARGRGKTADISGSRGGLAYAFEVCSARTAAADFTVDFLELKYDKKIRQAKVSGKRGGLDRAGLVLVAGPPVFLRFSRDGGLGAMARGVYERKNRPRATHICLLAGGKAAVFPDWEIYLRAAPVRKI